MNTRPTLHRLLGNSFWILLSEAINYPAGFLVTVWVAREISVRDFGVYAVVLALAMIAEQAISLRWADATIRFIGPLAAWREPAAALVQRQFLWGLVAAAAFGLGAAVVTAIGGEMGPALLVMIVHLPAAAVQNGLAGVLVAREMNRARSFVVTMRWVTRLAGTLIFLSWGWGAPGALLACAAGAWTEAAIAWWLARLPLLRWQRDTFESRVLAALFASGVALRIFLRLDLLLIHAFAGDPAMSGLYGAAKNLAQPAWAALTSLSKSTLFHVTTEPRESAGVDLLRRLAPWAISPLLVLPLLAGWSREFCGLLFGPDFRVAGDFLPWLYLGATAAGWMALVANLLLAQGRYAALLAATLPLPLLGLAVLGTLVFTTTPSGVAIGFAILAVGGAVGSLIVFALRSLPEAVQTRVGTVG